jgi:hypothetical protein
LAFSLLALMGCVDQQPKKVSSKRSSSEFNLASRACQSADLKSNLLVQDNAINIFKCIGWDNEYPKFFQLIKDFPKDKYAKLAELPNKTFFKDKKTKDEFFGLLAKNGDKDDFKGLNELFQLVFEQEGLLYLIKDLNEDLRTKSNEISLFDLLQDKEINSSFLNLFVRMMIDFKLKQNDIKPYQDIYNDPSYIKLQFKMFDQVVKSAISKGSAQKISKFIYYHGWPYNWLNYLSNEEFNDLFLFVGGLDDKVPEQSKLIRKMIYSEFVCDEYSGTYIFDHGEELNSRIQNLIKMDIDAFYADYIDLIQNYSLFKNVCSKMAQADQQMESFISSSDSIFEMAHQIFSMPGGFELVKNLARSGFDKSDPSSSSALLEFLHSDFFNSYSDVIKMILKKTDGEEYLSLWIEQFKVTDLKTLISIKKLFDELGKSQEVATNIDRIWSTLGPKSKMRLRSIFVDYLLAQRDLKSIEGLISDLENTYPSIFDLRPYDYNRLKWDDALVHITTALDDDELQLEVKKFFSKESFFKLIRLMGSTEDIASVRERSIPVSPDSNYVLSVNPDLEACFSWLGDKLEDGLGFWSLLDGYPSKCERNVGNYLSTHVVNWTLVIDEKFDQKYNRKFSIPYGVIAPDMMEYYLDLILLINKYVDQDDNYIPNIVNTIEEHMFELGLLQSLEDGLDLINYVNLNTKIFSNTLWKIFIRDADNQVDLDKDLKLFIKDLYYSDDESKPIKYKPLCKTLGPNISDVRCVSKNKIQTYFSRFKKHLLAPNWDGESPLDILLGMLYPDKGITIPYDSRYVKKYNLTLDKLVRFIYDLNDPKYNKMIVYSDKAGQRLVNTNVAERLEILIRDIAFLDNFYGAYFMNVVSRAKKYKKKVGSLKRNVYLLRRVGGFLRARGIYPEESEWKLNNILQTYDSLLEVAYDYPQHDGGKLSHQDLIQSFLTVVVQGSIPKANDFTAFRIPRLDLVKDHRGKIITMSTELSIVSRAGKMLNRFYPDKREILDSPKFKSVSKKLHNIISYDAMRYLLRLVLNHPNSNLLIEDLYDLFNELRPYQVKNMLSLTGNILNISSDCKACLDKYIPLVDDFLTNYKQIRKSFKKLKLHTSIEQIDNFMKTFSDYYKKDSFQYFSKVIQEVVDENLTIISQLIGQKEFWDSVVKTIASADNYAANYTESDGTELLIEILQDEKFDFEVLELVIQRVYANEKSLDYFDQIIDILNSRHDGRSNLYWAVDEIFVAKKDPLINFLESVLSKIRHQK